MSANRRDFRGIQCLLLDMNGTFVFGHDRFGDQENFHATYRQLGGHALTESEVTGFIGAAFHQLSALYVAPACYSSFPGVAETLRSVGAPESEIHLLDQVFAEHECGRVPDAHAAAIRELGRRFRMALVSNIWATSKRFYSELERAGVLSCFPVTVFSSDRGCIKPHESLFQAALLELKGDPANSMFVGDSLRCDIEPAHQLGLATAWIGPCTSAHPAADLVLNSLLELPAALGATTTCIRGRTC